MSNQNHDHDSSDREGTRQPTEDATRDTETGLSRRKLLSSAGIIAGASLAGSQHSQAQDSGGKRRGFWKKSRFLDRRRPGGFLRQQQAFQRRIDSAEAQRTIGLPQLETNRDERDYPSFIGSFSKTLPHNDLGEVDADAYKSFLKAMRSGKLADFDSIPAGGPVKLANPRAAFSFALSGADPHKIDMPAVHAFASRRQAAEAAEVYWMALARDVPFAEYETSPVITAAAEDLSSFSDFTAPRDGEGRVTPENIFRGQTPGDLAGPYLSQFLTLDIPYGNKVIPQVAFNPVSGDDHMTDFASWLAIQRGQLPGTSIQFESEMRPLETGRDLAEYVHTDFTYQAYLNAALICLGLGDALDPNEYSLAAREAGFITFGGAGILDLVARAARVALRPAWFHKWSLHRKLRPEAFGGRVEAMESLSVDYPIHEELLRSRVLEETFLANGNLLLAQAYPEGSPTHPSYPAGHATVAGACVTVLKAFFNEDYVIPYSGGLTLGGELNKLASNIALGRNIAGVHWRADGDDGLVVGESIAITLLQDELRTIPEDLAAFALTKFDGESILLTAE